MDCIQFNYKGLTLEANPREVSFRQSKKSIRPSFRLRKAKRRSFAVTPAFSAAAAALPERTHSSSSQRCCCATAPRDRTICFPPYYRQ